MGATVDAARVFSLRSPMHFPASLIPDREIFVGVWRHMRFSFLPEFEGDAVRFEDFFCRLVAEVSSPLIRSSRVPEQLAMLHLANPGNRFLSMSVNCRAPISALCHKSKRAGKFLALPDNEQLSGL